MKAKKRISLIFTIPIKTHGLQGGLLVPSLAFKKRRE